METDEFYLRHPRMPLEQRAKIFIPFEPLRGFREELASRERGAAPAVDLTDEQRFALSDALAALEPGSRVGVTHYRNGAYVQSRGEVARIRWEEGLMELGAESIAFEDVIDLERL